MELVHLNGISAISPCDYNLIICIRLGRLGTEAEVRRLSINRMQTILTYILLRVDENPTLSVLSCFTITFEVSTVNVPSSPVTTRIRTCIIASSQCIEEWIGLIHGTEDDVSVAVCISITTPLGSFNLYVFLFTCIRINLLLCIIQSNTIDKVAIESVTPLVNSIATQQDVKILFNCVYNGTKIIYLSFDAIIIKREVFNNVCMSTTNVLSARSNCLRRGVTLLPCLHTLRSNGK